MSRDGAALSGPGPHQLSVQSFTEIASEHSDLENISLLSPSHDFKLCQIDS